MNLNVVDGKSINDALGIPENRARELFNVIKEVLENGRKEGKLEVTKALKSVVDKCDNLEESTYATFVLVSVVDSNPGTRFTSEQQAQTHEFYGKF